MLVTVRRAFELAFQHERAGRVSAAREIYAGILRDAPGHPGALLKLAQHDIEACDLALARERLDAALAGAVERSLPIGEILFAQVRLQIECGDLEAAWETCRRTLQTPAPPYSARRMAAWLALQRKDAAEALSQAAHALLERPRDAEVLCFAAAARVMSDDLRRALEAWRSAIAADPLSAPALGGLVETLKAACCWDEIDAAEASWRAAVLGEGADGRFNPFIAVGASDDRALLLRAARRWSAATLPSVSARGPCPARGDRLRVGYLSSDFHEHATAHLMAGLFEAHDRSRFEIHAYSYDAPDDSPMRARLRAAFEHWHDLYHLADSQASALIASDRIDVLVDLKGHTHGSRLGILARRPAWLQIHYLGYPGTLGFDGIDAIVADAVTVPLGEEVDYHERVLRLPRCYQVNDDRRTLPAAADRAAVGLPPDATVLACFNQSYKLSRTFFEIWMEALRQQPRAVLWLLASNSLAEENLRLGAARAGVDPARIIIAPFVASSEHMARLRAADLALDVLPCGSHTTGSDALWAGVPLLTCLGGTFAGRVGASLAHAAGLPELVAGSIAEYRAKLLALVQDPGRLAALGHHLEHGRGRLPLFDTAGFTRDWEELLLRSYERMLATVR